MRILSIDGGGCLGCGPAELMKRLEETLPVSEDVLAGTSVGGLLVALRVTGLSWSQISNVFDEWCPVIFKDPDILWKMDPTRPKFPSKGIETAARTLLKDARCSDFKVPFYITSYDMKLGRPKVFDNTDPDLLSEVVLRTSAAPTYFAPRDSRWVDGAFTANNPSMIALTATMHKMGVNPEDCELLSLNTGGSYWKDPSIGARTTALGWASVAIKALMDGNEEGPAYQCDAILGARHTRIIPELDRPWSITDYKANPRYREIWADCFRSRRDALIRWAI